MALKKPPIEEIRRNTQKYPSKNTPSKGKYAEIPMQRPQAKTPQAKTPPYQGDLQYFASEMGPKKPPKSPLSGGL